MQTLRLNEVLMRVVAWHNHHPLARRINPSQVHSIGEVLLPFASNVAAPAAEVGAPGLPKVDELLDPPQAVGRVGTDLAVLRDADLGPAEPRPAADAADADYAAVARASPFTLVEADLAAQAAAAAQTTQVEPGPQDPDLYADLSLPLDLLDAAKPAPDADPPAAAAQVEAHASPFAAALAARSASVSASLSAAPTGRLQRLLARLPGRSPALPRLQAAFSRDFIWPLSPRRVARWARRHGQLQPLVPTDWPHRVVETDSAMLAAARQKGLGQSVALHVLTAAVGVGDRRLRLLMAADGQIIGPRAYSRPRGAAAGTLLALALLGVGWAGLRPATDDATTALAAAAAAVAASAADSAASTAAAAAAQAAMAATAASAALVDASAVATAASAAGPAPALAMAPTATPPEAAPDPAPGLNTQHNLAALAAPASPLHPEGAAATPAAPASTAAASADGNAAARVRVRPVLSDEDKQAARSQTAALRSGQPSAAAPEAMRVPMAPTAVNAPSPPAAPPTVYALVTPANPQRESANTGLVVMRRASGRLTPPVPEHTELMQDRGRWRAAWWPFASLADAERARVLLAGKGIKVEVVGF